jgi:hypothetical protein
MRRLGLRDDLPEQWKLVQRRAACEDEDESPWLLRPERVLRSADAGRVVLVALERSSNERR